MRGFCPSVKSSGNQNLEEPKKVKKVDLSSLIHVLWRDKIALCDEQIRLGQNCNFWVNFDFIF